mmetsp:Transcript_8420/g.23316  ORF Transcript_8420/g.23316 Transcript_8420/m.23316 type:complete len:234 (+) Transcript_8420:1831-2532(+)
MFDTAFKRPNVRASVGLYQSTISMVLTSDPVPFVHATIGKNKTTMTVSFSLDKVTLVEIRIGINQSALSFSGIFDKLTLVLPTIFPSIPALAVTLTVFKVANVAVTISKIQTTLLSMIVALQIEPPFVRVHFAPLVGNGTILVGILRQPQASINAQLGFRLIDRVHPFAVVHHSDGALGWRSGRATNTIATRWRNTRDRGSGGGGGGRRGGCPRGGGGTILLLWRGRCLPLRW